ncbi:MAG: tetratricopeptide repeat protein [Bacteroidaceae bacterium]|nr:tetratricopeptide repeat protein [Bacteroidaceae bacterium]
MAKQKKVAAPVNEIDEAVKESRNFVENHKNQILYGTGAILLIILAVLAAKQFYFEPRSERANDAIAQAQQIYAEGNYEKALTGDSVRAGFLSVIDEYGCTDAENLAYFYAAQCYFQMEKYQEAVDMLEQYDDCGDNMISPAAMGMLGDCYVAMGENEKGASALIKAAKRANNNAISPLCLVKAALIFEELGKKEEALKCYQNIKDNYKQSMQYNDVDKYIERLK